MTAPTLVADDLALATQSWATRGLPLSQDFGREVAQRPRDGSASHGRYRR